MQRLAVICCRQGDEVTPQQQQQQQLAALVSNMGHILDINNLFSLYFWQTETRLKNSFTTSQLENSLTSDRN